MQDPKKKVWCCQSPVRQPFYLNTLHEQGKFSSSSRFRVPGTGTTQIAADKKQVASAKNFCCKIQYNTYQHFHHRYLLRFSIPTKQLSWPPCHEVWLGAIGAYIKADAHLLAGKAGRTDSSDNEGVMIRKIILEHSMPFPNTGPCLAWLEAKFS